MNARATPPSTPANPAVPDWSQRNQEWLNAAIRRLCERLQKPSADAPIADSLSIEASGARDPTFTPALLHCARLFGLTPFERELLLLVAGLELDSSLRSAVHARSERVSSRASFALGLTSLTQPHWDALSPLSPLRYWQLLEPEAGAPLTQAALRIDERVLHFLTGVAADDAGLQGLALRIHLLPPTAPENHLVPLLDRIARALGSADEHRPVLVLHSDPCDPAAQRDVALAAAARAAPAALWIFARDLPSDPALLTAAARRVDRELAFTGALPVLALESAEGTGPVVANAVAFAGHLHSSLFWLGAPYAALSSQPLQRRVLRFDIPAQNAASTRAALAARWSETMGRSDPDVAKALERAGTQFHLGPGAVDSLMARLDATPPAAREATVWDAAREAARGGLEDLSHRVVTRASFDDLVLPSAQLAALHDIASELRHRETVYREWGFGDRQTRGQGLTALFAGESGTGKTLAAEVIANEVGLDLYQVDIASLVSKYIGETEKNLKKVFDAAETSGAVLLFDEADALFGKRSEVKDSHDRYANIEVAYLLQRIEAYRGLAILTTNMKSAIDRAFLRRIRFVVQFPFPDAAARADLWRRAFPPSAPADALDVVQLARLPLTGGSIRNIALNAAFIAAAGNGRIDAQAVTTAARAEFAKLERPPGDRTLESLG